MHRKGRKNQQGSFSLQATAFVSFITKMFWSIKCSSCNNSKNTVFQSNQGSAGFSCNSSKMNYQVDQQHNFLDVVHPQVCVLSPKNTEQLQFHLLQCAAICYIEESRI